MDPATAETLRPLLGDKWYGLLMLAVAICAMLATILPKPDTATRTGRIYAPLYGLIQLLACNWGRASNASGRPAARSGLAVMLLVGLLPFTTACSLKTLQPHEQALAVAEELTTTYTALHSQYTMLHDMLPEKRATLEREVAPALDASKRGLVLLRETASVWAASKQQPHDWEAIKTRTITMLGDVARLVASLKEG